MTKKKKKTETSDSIDVKERLQGPIKTVIANLHKLAEQYPDGEIEIGTHSEYGETYDHAYLNFSRPMTKLEIDLGDWRAKADQLQALKTEAKAFTANATPYPRQKELDALKKELGYFALAPTRGTLGIDGKQIVLWDYTRGTRLRDGTWVSRIIRGFSKKDEAKFEKMDDELDAAYLD